MYDSIKLYYVLLIIQQYNNIFICGNKLQLQYNIMTVCVYIGTYVCVWTKYNFLKLK